MKRGRLAKKTKRSSGFGGKKIVQKDIWPEVPVNGVRKIRKNLELMKLFGVPDNKAGEIEMMVGTRGKDAHGKGTPKTIKRKPRRQKSSRETST